MDPAVGFSVINHQPVLKRVSYQIQSNKESMLSNETHFNGIRLMQNLSVNPAKNKLRKNHIKNSSNPSSHFFNCTPINQQSFQTQVETRPNSHIQCQQTYLNFSQVHENRERKTFTSEFNPKQKHSSIKHDNEIEKLKNELSHLKGHLERYRLENQRHRCEKVEYEEAVYEMKIGNEVLIRQVKELKEQAASIKREYEMRRQRRSLVSSVLNYQHSQQLACQIKYEAEIKRLKASQSYSLEDIPNKEEVKSSNTADLELILSQMKQKLSQYEKKLAKKETLNNHQHYLLEKIKNEQSQLNTNQASLLQELEYVLTKNKKLKKENQQLKTQNEQIKKDNDERVAQVIQLQQLNAQLEIDIKELFWKVNQLEREKPQIEEKFHDITADTKEPFSSTHLSLRNSEELLPSSLTENLQQICKVLDQRQKTMRLELYPCYNIQIIPTSNDEQIPFGDTRFSKSVQLGDVDINYQIESRNELILSLEEQLQVMRRMDEQMEHDLQKMKLKLWKLMKDIQALEIQHEAMKNVFEEEKAHLQQEIQQKEHLLMVSLSLVEDLKIRQMSSKSITSIEDY